ncbi:Hypothetical_protein [Hexamita inflata]|uniref:Hypothetical_protein n=1 Tax=Hexamita inflata TaxID=28002 RepID=A0AA86TVT2_9EUKA|nr:Hypothetical protein HINF_LOCUS18254 [Hexamita inflata]
MAYFRAYVASGSDRMPIDMRHVRSTVGPGSYNIDKPKFQRKELHLNVRQMMFNSMEMEMSLNSDHYKERIASYKYDISPGQYDIQRKPAIKYGKMNETPRYTNKATCWSQALCVTTINKKPGPDPASYTIKPPLTTKQFHINTTEKTVDKVPSTPVKQNELNIQQQFNNLHRPVSCQIYKTDRWKNSKEDIVFRQRPTSARK